MMKGDSKTFRFFNSGGGGIGGGGGSRPAVEFSTVPPKNSSKQGRIRVYTGDKVVAPAKSKPRKRKTLAPPDSGGLSMECIGWSSRTYTPKQLVQNFGSNLPTIVKVTQGYHSAEEDLDLPTGEVVQLHSFGDQERIKARTSKNRLISIPLNHQIQARTIDPQLSEPADLEALLRRWPLPFQVEIHQVDQDAHGSMLNLVSEKVYLIELVHDFFLRANTIQDGWIDQGNIMLIPSHADVEFSVAESMHGATEEEWNDYKGMFARTVRHLNFKRVIGYQGVVDLDARPPRDSVVVAPKEVILDLLPTHTRNNSGDYDNNAVRNTQAQNKKNASQAYVTKHPHDGVEQDPVYQNLRIGSPKLPPKHKHLPPKKGKEEKKKGSKNHSPPPATAVKPTRDMTYQNYAYQSPAMERKKDRYRAAGEESGDELDVTEMFDTVIKVAEEEERKATLEGRRTSSEPRRYGSTAYLAAFDSPTTTLTPSNSQKHKPSYDAPQGQSGPFVVSVELNSLQRPTTKSDNNKHTPKKASTQPRPQASVESIYVNSIEARHFQTMDDVPEVLDNLSAQQVCECLRLLNMHNHVRDFEKRKVDGKKLVLLKERTLQGDFGFNPFNASKLARFIRGWRPKLE